MICVFLILLLLECSSALKFKSYAQTSFENGKVNREVSVSRWRETARRERLEYRGQIKQRRRWNELTRDRSLSFDKVTIPTSQVIVSLYIRRASFIKLKPKPKNPNSETSRYTIINNEWHYFRDIMVEGKPVEGFLVSLKNEASGVEEEQSRLLFEQFLATSIASLNVTRPFTASDAYQDMINIDPSITSILPPRNLEFGYALKIRPQRSADIETRLKMLDNPIFTLARPASPSRRLIMDLAKMDQTDFITHKANEITANSPSRKQELDSVLARFLEELLRTNQRRILVGIDGSATYHDLEQQKTLCASAGLVLLPVTADSPPMRISNETLCVAVRPINGGLQTALQAEIFSAVSAVGLISTLLHQLRCIIDSAGEKKKIHIDIEILSDSRAVNKIFRENLLQEGSSASSLSSPLLSSDPLKASLCGKLSEVQRLIEDLSQLQVTVNLSCQWVRGHPELQDPQPIRWDIKSACLWLADKIAEVEFSDVASEKDDVTIRSPFLCRLLETLQEKEMIFGEFNRLHDIDWKYRMFSVSCRDLL